MRSDLTGLGAAFLRRLDPETAHNLAIRALKAGAGPRVAQAADPVLSTSLCGLALPNCVGLAAGFDKNAEVADAMLAAGFGFVECGTVTPLAQSGNPRPRLFRLSGDRAVINRMGFNNEGLEPFAARLQARRTRGGLVGANFGANKDAADRGADYVAGLARLWGLADWFTANVSSPNTPGLRALQTRAALDDLLGRLAEARARLIRFAPEGVAPILLKVAPDLQDAEIEAIVESCLSHGVDGVIVSNTTVQRPASLRSRGRTEAGGLSGAPLFETSTAVLRRFSQAAAGKLALVGAGGVSSGEQAYGKIRAGACAVQLYSALVYAGPDLVMQIRRDLAARLQADGFTCIAEAVGA